MSASCCIIRFCLWCISLRCCHTLWRLLLLLKVDHMFSFALVIMITNITEYIFHKALSILLVNVWQFYCPVPPPLPLTPHTPPTPPPHHIWNLHSALCAKFQKDMPTKKRSYWQTGFVWFQFQDRYQSNIYIWGAFPRSCCTKLAPPRPFYSNHIVTHVPHICAYDNNLLRKTNCQLHRIVWNQHFMSLSKPFSLWTKLHFIHILFPASDSHFYDKDFIGTHWLRYTYHLFHMHCNYCYAMDICIISQTTLVRLECIYICSHVPL